MVYEVGQAIVWYCADHALYARFTLQNALRPVVVRAQTASLLPMERGCGRLLVQPPMAVMGRQGW